VERSATLIHVVADGFLCAAGWQSITWTDVWATSTSDRRVDDRGKAEFEPTIKIPGITTRDGTKIAYKDWGMGQPILFSHGWRLAGDAWDALRYCSSVRTAFGSSLTTDAAMAGRTSLGTATIWTSMPMTSPG
jgi:hypothetical protein